MVVERVDAEPSTSGGSVVALEVSEAESPGTASRHVGLVESDSELQGNAKRSLPVEMRCFDTAKIYAKAGDGGRGCVAFRREKYVPRGGPSGGNGGNGGHIWAQVDSSLNSLSNFRHHVHFRASPGTPGLGSNKHGSNGNSTTIPVPPGTIIRTGNASAAEPVLAELLQPGQRALLLPGGRGGRGNASFKSGRNTAPQLAEQGEEGLELWLELELKLVADVGLVGAPNAGKSTLLGVLSSARPKIADYPFTTLVPNLGVVDVDFRSIVVADIPGLLEGAHTGHGLGHEFLRHIQRCRALVHIIDGSSLDPVGDYDAIRTELELFNPELVGKPSVVAYNKMDIPDSSDYWEDVRASLLRDHGVAPEDCMAISAVTGQGTTELVRRLHALLDTLPESNQLEQEEMIDATSLLGAHKKGSGPPIDDFTVQMECKSPRRWRVEGYGIERFTQMTNWTYYEALLRFQRVLEASGINDALRKQGVREGDTVCVSEMEMDWSDDKSEKTLYGEFMVERKASGRVAQGSARWPHKGI